MIWSMQHEVLDREEVLGPLLEAICGVPGFEAAAYDVNGRDQWRAFDWTHALVDGLTQRTQWLRISSVDGKSLAMIALGKHGEVPTMIMNLAGGQADGLDVLLSGWGSLFEQVDVGFAAIYSESWRNSLKAVGVEPVMGIVQAWNAEALPASYEEILEVVDGCDAMKRYRQKEVEILVLGAQERVVSREHALALGRLQALMAQDIEV